MGDSVESLAEVEVDNIHVSPFIYPSTGHAFLVFLSFTYSWWEFTVGLFSTLHSLKPLGIFQQWLDWHVGSFCSRCRTFCFSLLNFMGFHLAQASSLSGSSDWSSAVWQVSYSSLFSTTHGFAGGALIQFTNTKLLPTPLSPHAVRQLTSKEKLTACNPSSWG